MSQISSEEPSSVKLEPIEEILLDEYCDETDDHSYDNLNVGTLKVLETTAAPIKQLEWSEESQTDDHSYDNSDAGTSPLEVLETTAAPTKRLKWSEVSLAKAIDAVNNRNYSLYKASIEYGIPRSTLIRQWKDNKLTKNKIGRKPVLTPEQEDLLTRRIRRIVDINYPVTPDYFCRCVYKFCEENRIKSNFSKDKEAAGSYWLRNFRERYPDIVEMTKQRHNPSKSLRVSHLIAQDFYHKLQQTIEKIKIMDRPILIYNVECKTLKINLATGLANLRDSDIQEANQPEEEEVKVMCAANASGEVIPLMVIFKGDKVKSKWCKDFPYGAIARVTKYGDVTSDIFNDWLRHFQRQRPALPCLLLFNEATLPLDYSNIQLADQLDITLLCLPGKNCIHELRPIYIGCFKAFDNQWTKEIEKFWRIFNSQRETFKAFSRQTFGKVLSSVWAKVMIEKNIKSGFETTGIYPYKPSIVLEVSQDILSSSSVSLPSSSSLAQLFSTFEVADL